MIRQGRNPPKRGRAPSKSPSINILFNLLVLGPSLDTPDPPVSIDVSRTGEMRPVTLILLFSGLFPASLPGQRLFYALLFARFQVKRMPLDLFNDVFLLYLAFKAPQGILKGFTLLQSNFRQRTTPPNRSEMDPSSFTRFTGQVKRTLQLTGNSIHPTHNLTPRD